MDCPEPEPLVYVPDTKSAADDGDVELARSSRVQICWVLTWRDMGVVLGGLEAILGAGWYFIFQSVLFVDDGGNCVSEVADAR